MFFLLNVSERVLKVGKDGRTGKRTSVAERRAHTVLLVCETSFLPFIVCSLLLISYLVAAKTGEIVYFPSKAVASNLERRP